MDIIIEHKSNSDVRLQTRPSGDVEVIETSLRKQVLTNNMPAMLPGGPHDTLIGVIPKSQRAAIADFLVSAQ